MKTFLSKHPWASAGAAALLVALIVMATWIVRASYVSPEQRLTASTEDLVKRAFAADPTALDMLFDVSYVGTAQLLTPETAAVAMGPAASYRVDSAQLADRYTFEVRGTLNTSSGPVPVTVSYERSKAGAPWELEKLELPRIMLSAPARGEVTINGVRVSSTGITVGYYTTWPGQVRLAGEGLTIKDIKLLGPLSTDARPGEGRLTLTAAGGAVDAAGLEAALERKLNACLGPADLARAECVFAPPEPPRGSTSVRGVEFSDLRLGERKEDTGRGATLMEGEQLGTVLVTGQWKTATGWQDFSTRTSFEYAYTATAGPTGVEVLPNPERGDAAYESNAAWGRALTDRGSSDDRN